MTDFLITSPDGRKFKVTGPEGATKDQVLGYVAKNGFPQAMQSAPEQSSVLGDVAKSAGVGIAKGLIGGTVALPGNIVDLAGRGAAWAGRKAGINLPDPNEYNPLPTSESVQKRIENVTGPFYKPQTKAGKFAETIGEFAGGPTSYVGKGVSLGRKLAGAVAGGAASETAGQLTEGSDYEPLARIAGGVAGGAASGAGRRGSGTVSADTLDANAAARYRQLENSNTTINGDQFVRVLDTLEGQLRQAHFRPYNAKGAWDVLDDIRSDLTNKQGVVRDVTMGDIQGLKELLKNVPHNNDKSIAAASQLHDMIDTYLGQVPQHHLISGDPARDVRLLREASADYRGARRSDALDMTEDRARRQANRSGVGANQENTLRQRIDAIINSPTESRRYSQRELDIMREIVNGTLPINELRRIGKFAPTSVVSSAPTAAAFLSGHPTLGMALGGAGWVGKTASERLTRNKVRGLAEDIRSNTPSGRAYTPPTPPIGPYQARGALGALPGAQEQHEPLRLTVHPLAQGNGP
jgi:hypothetical protein